MSVKFNEFNLAAICEHNDAHWRILFSFRFLLNLLGGSVDVCLRFSRVGTIFCFFINIIVMLMFRPHTSPRRRSNKHTQSHGQLSSVSFQPSTAVGCSKLTRSTHTSKGSIQTRTHVRWLPTKCDTYDFAMEWMRLSRFIHSYRQMAAPQAVSFLVFAVNLFEKSFCFRLEWPVFHFLNPQHTYADRKQNWILINRGYGAIMNNNWTAGQTQEAFCHWKISFTGSHRPLRIILAYFTFTNCIQLVFRATFDRSEWNDLDDGWQVWSKSITVVIVIKSYFYFP